MTVGRLWLATAAMLLVAGSGCAPEAGSLRAPAASGAVRSSPLSDGQAFSSSVYGYEAVVPAGWSVEPATSRWDGGDVDHKAGYADRFDAAGTGFMYTIGTATDKPLPEFAKAHVAWVSENRCPQPGAPAAPVDAVIGGVPAVRVALACPAGIYGPTLVSKAIVVRDGVGVIFTAFSPDPGSESFPPLDDLLASVRWTVS